MSAEVLVVIIQSFMDISIMSLTDAVFENSVLEQHQRHRSRAVCLEIVQRQVHMETRQQEENK